MRRIHTGYCKDDAEVCKDKENCDSDGDKAWC